MSITMHRLTSAQKRVQRANARADKPSPPWSELTLPTAVRAVVEAEMSRRAKRRN